MRNTDSLNYSYKPLIHETSTQGMLQAQERRGRVEEREMKRRQRKNHGQENFYRGREEGFEEGEVGLEMRFWEK